MKKCIISLALSLSMLLGICLIAASCTDTERESTGTTAPEATESKETDSSSSTTEASDEASSSETETSIETNTETATETDSDTDTATETITSTETESESSDATDTSESTTEATAEETDAIYENGQSIKDAGFEWYDDAYAYVEHKVNVSKAIDITAAELKPLLTAQTLKENSVYRVTDELSLDSDTKYYGNGAAIIATKGITIKDAKNIVIKNVVILGELSVTKSSGITLFNCDIQSSENAVIADEASSDIVFKDCKVSTDKTAITSSADTVSFYQSYIKGDKAFVLSGTDVAIQNCHIVALSNAIQSNAAELVVRNNLIEVNTDGTGIELTKGSYNSLIALNIIKNAQNSVKVSDSFNSVVLLNSAVTVLGENNVNLYIVENKLGGRIRVKNNQYLLCDGNGYLNDSKEHSIINVENLYVNGDNITDVDARADVGALEELLPQTNKDLFVGMDRKSTVRDISIIGKEYSLNEYIRQCARAQSIVIVPPGAYTLNTEIAFETAHSNTVVYAYGVYEELSGYTSALTVTSAKNVKVRGLTMGFAGQSSGQVYVVKKLSSKKLKVVTAAGYVDDFGKSNTEIFSSSFADLFKAGTMYNWVNDYYTSITHNDDGTMTLTLNDEKTYRNTAVGDILTCRLGVKSATSVKIDSSENVNFKDCVLYGHSSALAVVAEGKSKNISLERFHNTVHSAPTIDEETYQKYLALENEYNVDLEISQDENGNYRGSLPRVCSADATHINGTNQGMSVTSSLFENMCDDGTNQHAASGRLESIVDNGDGSATITYRSNLSDTYFVNYGSTRGSVCEAFENGSHILIYAPNGEIVCDTTTTSSSSYLGAQNFTLNYSGITRNCDALRYSVNVKAADVNFDALEGYDLSDNSPAMTNKILVDNLSRSSSDFTFDNVLIQNIRSRAMLIKTVDVNVKNCTFRNIATTGLLLKVEPNWGESTVARDVSITNCLFDHIGYHGYLNNDSSILTNKLYAAITIQSVSEEPNDNSLPIKNITIKGCEFINNRHQYAIVVNSAQNVKVLNNTFGKVVGSYEKYAVSIDVSVSKDVEISGNTYDSNATKPIRATKYKNIYGTDVTDEDGNLVFPD